MGIVHEKPGWWSQRADDLHRSDPDVRADRPVVVIAAQVRPLGPSSYFADQQHGGFCVNCAEWIRPGDGAWYDPGTDRAVCAACWPASVVSRRTR